jgi:hypothetical protein
VAIPVIANVSPVASTTIPATQVLSYEVTSTPSLVRTMLFARFPGMNLEEVVYDGTNFTERYAGRSSRTAITNGFRFNVLRDPIWPDSPELTAYQINSSAEELSQSWSYVLQSPVVEVSDTAIPQFPMGVPQVSSESGFVANNQAYYLRLAERVLDSDYIKGLQAGEGYELLQAFAEINERASTALKNTAEGMFISYAQFGSFAEGTVEFYRTAAHGAVIVKAGTIVQASGGRFFRTLNDVSFGALDLGPVSANVRSIFQTYQHNVTGTIVTDSGITLPGEIDTIRILVEDPPFGDPSIKVRQISAMSGGRSPSLELLAIDRGVALQPGESAVSLAYRLRHLPENITPNAMRSALTTLLEPYKATFEFVEPFDLDFETAYDMGEGSNIFTYDDPRDLMFPAINWVSDERELWGAFYVNISQIEPIEDYGGCYDDPATTADQLISPNSGGRRAIPAYDLPDSSTFGVGADLGLAFDGRDVAQDALLDSVWELLTNLRAAGIVAGLQQKRN